MAIEVRPVRPEEYDEAGVVVVEAYREFVRPEESGWDEYLGRLGDVAGRAGHTLALVAVEGMRILGCVTLELEARTEAESGEPLLTEEAHVRMLGVRAEDRRRGVGRRLMEGCIDEARRAGKSLVTLHTTERMTAAQRMYESMGFERGQDYVFPDGFRLLGYERRI